MQFTLPGGSHLDRGILPLVRVALKDRAGEEKAQTAAEVEGAALLRKDRPAAGARDGERQKEVSCDGKRGPSMK